MSDSKASPFSTGGSAASRGSQPIATNARGIQGTTATTESTRTSTAGELVLENKLEDALSPYVCSSHYVIRLQSVIQQHITWWGRGSGIVAAGDDLADLYPRFSVAIAVAVVAEGNPELCAKFD